MKHLNNIIVFILMIFFSISCSKSDTENSNTINNLQIINNLDSADSENALQAIHTANSTKCYYYGSFNSAGEPSQLKQMIIKDTIANNSVNIFLDDQLRTESLYLTQNNLKINSLLVFDYSISGKTTMNVYDYDFDTFESKITNKFTFDNSTSEPQLIESTQYASFGSGLISLIMRNNLLGVTTTPPNNDNFASQIFTAVAGLVGVGPIIVASTTTAGCLIGKLPGCVIGGIVGMYVAIKPANASESTISSTPANSPLSPSSQTQNTQLQSTSYFVGTKSTIDQISFGGGIYCNYTSEYYNVSIDFKINKINNSIIQSQIFVYQKESITNQACSTQPVIPINMHKYTYNNGTYTGNNINIIYSRIIGGPSCEATFNGIKSGKTISGTITLNRNDVGTSSVDYTINIPVSLRLIN